MKTDNKSYIIGIDTGGTYTDAVMIRKADNQVIRTAKHPTTHSNLSLGISECLKKLFTQAEVRPAEVDLVAVSTTLATNAVVEGRGAEVGLIVAGPAEIRIR